MRPVKVSRGTGTLGISGTANTAGGGATTAKGAGGGMKKGSRAAGSSVLRRAEGEATFPSELATTENAPAVAVVANTTRHHSRHKAEPGLGSVEYMQRPGPLRVQHTRAGGNRLQMQVLNRE